MHSTIDLNDMQLLCDALAVFVITVVLTLAAAWLRDEWVVWQSTRHHREQDRARRRIRRAKVLRRESR